jgi:hypothetical protein
MSSDHVLFGLPVYLLLAALLGFGLAEVRADYSQPMDAWRRVGAFLTANVRPGDRLGAPDVQANGERFWFVWSDYTLLPIDDTRAWASSLTGVTFRLDPRIRVIFVHPGRSQAEMLEEAEEFVIPPPSVK